MIGCRLVQSVQVKGAARVNVLQLRSSTSNRFRVIKRHTSTLRSQPYKQPYNWKYVSGAVCLAAGITLYASSTVLYSDALPKTLSGKEGNRKIAASEVMKHKEDNSLWVVIGKDVWDVTEFADIHPGGPALIRENGGKDITKIFNTLHQPNILKKALTPDKKVGEIDESTAASLEVARDPADIEVERRRNELPPVYSVYNLHMFEEMAKEMFDEGKIWGYISSYADDGYSYHSNKSSFSLVRFVPRVLVPVGNCDTQAILASKKLFDLPIYISPTGLARMAHPGGEANLVRAAQRANIPYCVSSGSSMTLKEIFDVRDEVQKESGKRADVWFQLYIRSDRAETEKIIREAVDNGTGAILFTVDAPVVGKREGDTAIHARGGPPPTDVTRFFDANLKWEDIKWIKKIAPKTPLFLKGVASADDASKAYESGADGIVLSNHGGRQLDFAPPPISTLLHIRNQHPELIDNSKFDIYIDGGVRRGTDVLKALCLGAKGVGLGRSFIYANATYGADGVNRAAEILKEEIETGMRLLGANSIKDLKPEMVELLPGLIGEIPKSNKKAQ